MIRHRLSHLLPRRVATTLGLLLGTLLLVPSGAGAASWLAPAALSAGDGATSVRVALAPAGDAAAVWLVGSGDGTQVMVSTRPAGGAWSAPAAISPAGGRAATPVVALDAHGGGVVAWRTGLSPSSTVQASTRTAGGDWSAPVTVSHPGADPGLSLAVDAAGDALLAWTDSVSAPDSTVGISGRPAGGTWAAPSTFTTPGADLIIPRVALDAAGDAALVALSDGDDGGRVMLAARPGGAIWSGLAALSAAADDADEPAVALDAHGDATVVWSRVAGSSDDVQAVQRAADGTVGPISTLSDDTFDAGRPQVAVDPAGDAIAAWSADTAVNTLIQASSRPPDGAWSGPQTLSAASVDADAAAVAIGDLGDARVAWRGDEGDGVEVVQATYRQPSAPWAPVSDLSSSAAGGADSPSVSADSRGDLLVGFALGASQGVSSAEVAVLDDSGPALGSLVAPDVLRVGASATFSVAASDVWSSVAAPVWQFDDGTSTTAGGSVEHAFAATGTYAVDVTATDAAGNSTTLLHHVSVTADGSPPVGTAGARRLRLSGVRARPPRFRARAGTRLSYVVSARARVQVVLLRQGRRRPVGAVWLPGRAGRNQARVPGRWNRRLLRRGRFVLLVQAVAPGARSGRIRVPIVVLPPRATR